VQGTNGFRCYVERSWAKTTNDPEFWNPKMRAPNCFNDAAARSIAQIYLMKTRLVLAGQSKEQIAHAIAAALDEKKLPALAPGAMCYMMSKQQYLSDSGTNWHPHLMFYVSGDAAKSWGADASEAVTFRLVSQIEFNDTRFLGMKHQFDLTALSAQHLVRFQIPYPSSCLDANAFFLRPWVVIEKRRL
jgi:hypothetical protein